MNSEQERKVLNAISERVIGCAFRVANELGCGFLEKGGSQTRRSRLLRPTRIRYTAPAIAAFFRSATISRSMLGGSRL
jgi:hypothetical protein